MVGFTFLYIPELFEVSDPHSGVGAGQAAVDPVQQGYHHLLHGWLSQAARIQAAPPLSVTKLELLRLERGKGFLRGYSNIDF